MTMRKVLLTTAALCMLTLHAKAQDSGNAKRLVLIEEFTNTGCGPCASWSPLLDSCIRYRLGDVIAIKYHAAYPERTDVFYNENVEVQQAKNTYYGVTGVPSTFVNGMDLGERSYASLNGAISYCLANQPDDYAIRVERQLADGQLSVKAVLTPININKAAGETRDLRLNVAAIEEHIDMRCSNGETELNYTMRSMLTGPEGVSVGQAFATDQTAYTYEGEASVAHFRNQGQLGVVAFVQDYDTREVLCTAYIGPEAEGENRLALMNLIDTPDLICTPDYYGKVIFRNDGAGTLSSATLNVSVNGAVKQYPWTGSLAYLDRDTLAFSGHTDFSLNDTEANRVEVWFSHINGTDTESNARTATFSHSIRANYGVQLKIYTDKKPEETTWKLYNSAGDVVRQGGPYDGLARKFITENMGLTADDCYLLEFEDAGGDGIKGASGNGYYQLFQVNEAGKATRIAQGDYDGSVYDVYFRLDGAPAPPHRLVLFEEFTNTSCDPCAEFSPSLDRTIYQRMGDMVAITYHWNFPSRTDPFYLANPDDALARAEYYGVTGVPSLRVNGEHVGAWGYEDYLDGYVTGAGEVPAKAEVSATATLSDGLLTVSATVLPLATADKTDLRLHVAAVEERVEWNQPAANGERAWNYVMRKLLTGPDGQQIDTETAQVTPYQYQYSWQVENLYDETELGIVTFVQDNVTKEVLAAVYTPRPTGNDRAAKILQVLGTPDRICTPLFTADVAFRNTGSVTLTAADVHVSINGQQQVTRWTGSLAPLAIDTLRLPAFTDFTLAEGTANTVEIWLSDLNDDATAESAHRQLTVSNAAVAQNAVRLTIMTDNAPEEITWQLLNAAGDVIRQGGPYTEARKKQVIDLNLDTDDCYTLEFTDAGGNGIADGRGYYMLHEVSAEGKTRLLKQDTYSGAHHEVYFGLQNAAPSADGIQPTSAESQRQQPAYDLQGRPANQRTPVVIRQGRVVAGQ